LRGTSIFIVCFFLLLGTNSQAQKGWEVGAWLGISNYFGDLNTDFDLSDPGLAGGLNGRYNFNSRISLKFSLNYGSIRGSDADSPNTFERERNLSFKSRIFDMSPQLEFNFFPYVHGSKEYYYTPYIFGGFSIFHFNPRAELNGEWYSLRDFGTEGQVSGDEYRRFNGAFLFGGGFKFDVSHEWSINIELGIRRVFTDYIDDVSQTYPDLLALAQSRGPIAAELSDRSGILGLGEPGRQRGNSKDNDSYHFFGISIMKYFGRLECPKILEQF
jgi:hypothetical protein